MTSPSLHDCPSGQAAVFTTACPTSEKTNEDSLVVLPLGKDSQLFAVADGVGGGKAGAQASGLLVKTLASADFDEHGGSFRPVILDSIERANTSILGLGIGAACTLALVEIRGMQLRSYHVGDSFVMVVGRQGKLKYLTLDHSPVAYAVEAGLITPDEAIVHEERNLVSNVVGFAEMRIDIGPKLTLDPGDTVLVGSDGVSDNLREIEIKDLIRKGKIAEVGEQLLNHCLERMLNPNPPEPSKPDDLSFIVYRP